jgi:hypothetical protein
MTGTTSNGFLHLFWDLKDDAGNRVTNQVLDSAFEIALPESGRMQKLKGP